MPNQNNTQNNDQNYKDYVDEISPKPTYIKNYIMAFIVGGIICIIGQAINDSYMHLAGLDKKTAATWTSITLIFIGSFLTGIGVYDLIGRRAGAGSIIPITGFANSVAAPAIEFQNEGMVMGVGAKIFTIAGPVILYGIFTSWVLGVCYWVWSVM